MLSIFSCREWIYRPASIPVTTRNLTWVTWVCDGGGGNFIWHEKYVPLFFAFIVQMILCIYAFDSKLYDPNVHFFCYGAILRFHLKILPWDSCHPAEREHIKIKISNEHLCSMRCRSQKMPMSFCLAILSYLQVQMSPKETIPTKDSDVDCRRNP